MKSLKAALAVGVVLGLGACTGAKQAQHGFESSVPFLSSTSVGVVTATAGEDIAVYDPDHPENQSVWFRRMPDTVLIRAGKAVSWEAITEGTPVKVVFEPAAGAERALRVEVLTGQEAAAVRAKTQAPPRPAAPPPVPGASSVPPNAEPGSPATTEPPPVGGPSPAPNPSTLYPESGR